MSDDRKEHISPEDHSVTPGKKRYLRCLCDGPKDAHEIADELASDPTVPKAHRSETVADRLAYLARYAGTEHLVERDGNRYRPTEDGRVVLC